MFIFSYALLSAFVLLVLFFSLGLVLQVQLSNFMITLISCSVCNYQGELLAFLFTTPLNFQNVCVRSVACLGFCRFHQCKKPGSRSILSAPCLSSGLPLSLTLVSSRRKVVIVLCATRISHVRLQYTCDSLSLMYDIVVTSETIACILQKQ